MGRSPNMVRGRFDLRGVTLLLCGGVGGRTPAALGKDSGTFLEHCRNAAIPLQDGKASNKGEEPISYRILNPCRPQCILSVQVLRVEFSRHPRDLQTQPMCRSPRQNELDEIHLEMWIFPYRLGTQLREQRGHIVCTQPEHQANTLPGVYAPTSRPFTHELHSHLVVLEPVPVFHALQEQILQLYSPALRPFDFERYQRVLSTVKPEDVEPFRVLRPLIRRKLIGDEAGLD